MSKIEGDCRCGGIHYESDSAPSKLIASNCRHDHRHPKATIAVSLGIPKRTLNVRGLSPSVYKDTKPNGSVVLRSFCPECGTPLFTETGSEPTMIFIKADTLDGDVWMQPQVFYNSERYRTKTQPATQGRRWPNLLAWLNHEMHLKLHRPSFSGPGATDRLSPVLSRNFRASSAAR